MPTPDDDRPVGATANGHHPTGGTAPAPGGEDPTIVALGRALQRALRRIDTVDRNVLQLAADVAALAGRLAPPGGADGPGDEPAPVRSWLLTNDADQAAADLSDLTEWMGRVYVRYTRAQLSSCWLWHPEVIEELWWLRCAHADAFHPDSGSWLRVGDWHDRQRTGVERRVNALLGGCSLSRHVDRNGRPAEVTEPTPPPLVGHYAAVAAHWAATRTAGPTPSPAVVTEAEQAEFAQHGGYG
ncbi:hypothetical protein [Pseudonocardia sp.]|uniref:hypothetical protein n=1 Tax=Pseudonocardia sp. TaxID=60912 RepID=UPI002616CC08|nr:hypothetical protein [Pseudonocardia sp.]